MKPVSRFKEGACKAKEMGFAEKRPEQERAATKATGQERERDPERQGTQPEQTKRKGRDDTKGHAGEKDDGQREGKATRGKAKQDRAREGSDRTHRGEEKTGQRDRRNRKKHEPQGTSNSKTPLGKAAACPMGPAQEVP